MSQNAASPPSRPPSSASSTASSSLGSLASSGQLGRVHDHSRPLPPPRLPGVAVPLSTASSIRSPPRGATPTTGEVSLQAPRPDGERVANEYVDTPFRPAAGPRATEPAHEAPSKQQQQQRGCPKASGPARVHRAPRTSGTQRQHNETHLEGHLEALTGGRGSVGRAVTKQPVSFTKEPAAGAGSLGPGPTAGLSIMCDRCGRCRCESCREPPPLPSRWLCDNACFCSAETALDYASCLCCVKGLFYHCADGGLSLGAGAASSSLESDELGGSCADEPCSCTGARKTARWTCLGALALLLPCLLCYWPLKGCVALCEACYAKHATQGCRCDPRSLGRPMPGSGTQGLLTASGVGATTTTSPRSQVSEALMRDSRDPEKRLLDPIGPEL